MWDLIVSVPDHCSSFYFSSSYLVLFKSYADFRYVILRFTRTILPQQGD